MTFEVGSVKKQGLTNTENSLDSKTKLQSPAVNQDKPEVVSPTASPKGLSFEKKQFLQGYKFSVAPAEEVVSEKEETKPSKSTETNLQKDGGSNETNILREADKSAEQIETGSIDNDGKMHSKDQEVPSTEQEVDKTQAVKISSVETPAQDPKDIDYDDNSSAEAKKAINDIELSLEHEIRSENGPDDSPKQDTSPLEMAVNPADFHPDQPIQIRPSNSPKTIEKSGEATLEFYQDKVAELWSKYDTEQAGVLDKIEVANFVLEVMTAQGRTLDSDKFYRFFSKFDKENTGEVN